MIYNLVWFQRLSRIKLGWGAPGVINNAKERRHRVQPRGKRVITVGHLGVDDGDARIGRGVTERPFDGCARGVIVLIALFVHRSLLLPGFIAASRTWVIKIDQGSATMQVGDSAIATRLQ